MATQRFTCSENGTSKFWEISVEGATLTVRYGKLGSEGQAKAKTLATPEQAEAERAKLVREKTRKGYVEDTSAPPDAPVAAAPPARPPVSAVVAESGSPVVADPRLRLSRTFQRGDALFRVTYSDDAVLEQDGDAEPREKKLTSPDAILRAVDKAIEKRTAEGFTEVTSPLPADVDPVASFDDAALAELHALRRFPGPARVVDLDLAWGAILSACAEIASYLDEAPAGAEPEAQEDVDAAVRWLRSAAPLPLPSTGAVAVAAFLLAAHRSPLALESLVDVVVGGGDVARATEVLVGYLERCERWVVLPVDDEAARQQPGGDFAAGPAPFRRGRRGRRSRARRALARARLRWREGLSAMKCGSIVRYNRHRRRPWESATASPTSTAVSSSYVTESPSLFV